MISTPDDETPESHEAEDRCRTCGLDFVPLEVACSLERRLRALRGERDGMVMVPQAFINAAISLSAFCKNSEYPERPSESFEELTRLIDIQDTEVRRWLSARPHDERKG